MFLLFFCALAFAAEAQTPGKRKNVLFIFVDDLRPELGCYGNPIIRTPNIDKLASGSFVFLNHYVQVPTCGASRYSMLTGMLPRFRGQLTNEAFVRYLSEKPEEERPETFIHNLRRNGYRTAGIGKISHSADGKVYAYTGDPTHAPRELPHSWDELLFNPGQWKTGWNAFFGYADGSNRQSMKGKVKPYEKGDVGDDGYRDGLTADLAVKELAQLARRGEPFFLGVGFFKPHLPFNSPAAYWDLYDESVLPLTLSPDLPADVNTASFHNSGEFNSYKSGVEKPSLTDPVSEAYARKLTHAYYAAVSYTDAQVGKVLRALEESGEAANTIVVLWGDHGWHLGDHRVWNKHTLSDCALRSPLIIRVPGMQGGRVESIVSSVDIYPTLMELCGLAMPYGADGHSVVPLLQGEADDRAAYSYFNNGVTVRTSRYRLTRYFRKQEPVVELYDHKQDPHENRNIAGRRKHLVKKLVPLLVRGNTGLYERE